MKIHVAITCFNEELQIEKFLAQPLFSSPKYDYVFHIADASPTASKFAHRKTNWKIYRVNSDALWVGQTMSCLGMIAETCSGKDLILIVNTDLSINFSCGDFVDFIASKVNRSNSICSVNYDKSGGKLYSGSKSSSIFVLGKSVRHGDVVAAPCRFLAFSAEHLNAIVKALMQTEIQHYGGDLIVSKCLSKLTRLRICQGIECRVDISNSSRNRKYSIINFFVNPLSIYCLSDRYYTYLALADQARLKLILVKIFYMPYVFIRGIYNYISKR